MDPGTHQNQRLAAVLSTDFVRPDELTLAQRICLTLEYGAKLRFKDQAGEDSGSWRSVLLRDETFVLADMAAFPIERLKSQFSAVAPSASTELIVEYFWGIAIRIDEWVRCLHGILSKSAELVTSRLADEISARLAMPLRQSLMSRHPRTRRMLARSWHPLWGVEEIKRALSRDSVASEVDLVEAQPWRSHVVVACRSLQSLSEVAQLQLPSSLKTGIHDPAMGLLLSFLQLVERCSEPLNRFPERLIEFYYRDVLRMRKQAPPPEYAHLILERDPNYDKVVEIPAGTKFLAGEDADGDDIVFTADRNQQITDLTVQDLYTVCLERSPAISPEAEYGYATRVHVESLVRQAPSAAYAQRPAWWPLFGGRSKGSAACSRDARIGMAIVSTLFDLREGEREIRLRCLFAHPASTDEVLREQLRSQPSARSANWLSNVFDRYRELDERCKPSDPASLKRAAHEAWERAGQRGVEGDLRLRYLVARCLEIETDGVELRARLGTLFATWLLAKDDLLDCDWQALRKHARNAMGRASDETVTADNPLVLIFGEHPPQRELPFDRIFRDIFAAKVSTEVGWHSLGTVSAYRLPLEDSPLEGGFELVIHLGVEQPAVCACEPGVHGSEWPQQPVLQLELRTQTLMCAYSLLQQLELQRLEITVMAHGIQDLILQNQLGRLDSNHPFQPFGPLPSCGDFLVLGAAELAQKPLKSLRTHIQWAGLPNRLGWPEYYRGYPGNWSNDGFTVRFGILRDKQWQSGSTPSVSLFEMQDDRMTLAVARTLSPFGEDVLRLHKPELLAKDEEFAFGGQRRNGFFRMELTGPEDAFGHRVHSGLVSEILTHNARARGSRRALPRVPYTPVIEHLTLDYSASRTIDLTTSTVHSTSLRTEADRLFYLHPIGHEEIRPEGRTRRWPLLPRIEHDGNLFIGLAKDGERLEGPPRGALSLFFQLRKEAAAQSRSSTRRAPTWFTWTEHGWQALDSRRVLFDTTQGFLLSGIVGLDLPEGMVFGCPGLPAGCYWLRLSANGDLEQFAGLYGVFAQAVRVTRLTKKGLESPPKPIATSAIRGPTQPIAGLRSVSQAGSSYGGRSEANPMSLRTVTSERLRHKGRASQSWDYERLVLEAFPDVLIAKCFAHLIAPLPGSPVIHDDAHIRRLRAPGHVLVVVVPAPRQGELFRSTEAPRLDPATIQNIEEYLCQRASGGAQITVRNASYERLQVRCAIRLERGFHPGTAVRDLNEAIVRYLSPWHTEGLSPTFGWEVRLDELEAAIRALEYVQSVGRLSMLQFMSNEDRLHASCDTARAPVSSWQSARLRAAAPFSLPLPMVRHLIEVLEQPVDMVPKRTGLGRLEVGQTFIISRSPDDK